MILQNEFIKKRIFMNNIVKENEILDDLQINDLYIIQKKDGFKFGTDAVLLSDFAKKTKADKIFDLCTGSGIIPLLLCAKTKASHIAGLEIQTDVAEMAQRSVSYNGLEDRVLIKQGNLCDVKDYFTPHSFDCVTINPPYMKADVHVTNLTDSKAIARHEILCTLEDCISACAKMLKFRGDFFMVHRPKRLLDIIELMRKEHIEPKILRFVHSKKDSEPSMVLVHGVYHGGSELKVLSPLIIYNDDGSETEELKKIYGRNR